jgi:hypothetical protein
LTGGKPQFPAGRSQQTSEEEFMREQTADAILALINSKPRTPTRDEITEVLASQGMRALSRKNGPCPPLLVRPTDLGWKMIERLPERAEVLWHLCSMSDDDPDRGVLDAWDTEGWSEESERLSKASHFVDLAIAWRIAADGETPDARLRVAQKCDPLLGYDAPDTPEEAGVDSPDMAAYRLVCAILDMAGLNEEMCSIASIHVERGWATDDKGMGLRQPTEAERHAILARAKAKAA